MAQSKHVPAHALLIHETSGLPPPPAPAFVENAVVHSVYLTKGQSLSSIQTLRPASEDGVRGVVEPGHRSLPPIHPQHLCSCARSFPHRPQAHQCYPSHSQRLSRRSNSRGTSHLARAKGALCASFPLAWSEQETRSQGPSDKATNFRIAFRDRHTSSFPAKSLLRVAASCGRDRCVRVFSPQVHAATYDP